MPGARRAARAPGKLVDVSERVTEARRKLQARWNVLLCFAGVLPANLIVQTMLSAYACKVAYQTAATPLTYAAVAFLKRVENIDVFDARTNDTPFRLEV